MESQKIEWGVFSTGDIRGGFPEGFSEYVFVRAFIPFPHTSCKSTKNIFFFLNFWTLKILVGHFFSDICIEASGNEGTSHHSGLLNLPSCGGDIDYQTFTTALSMYWNYNQSDAFIQYHKVSVEKRTQRWVCLANTRSPSMLHTWISIFKKHFLLSKF